MFNLLKDTLSFSDVDFITLLEFIDSNTHTTFHTKEFKLFLLFVLLVSLLYKVSMLFSINSSCFWTLVFLLYVNSIYFSWIWTPYISPYILYTNPCISHLFELHGFIMYIDSKYFSCIWTPSISYVYRLQVFLLYMNSMYFLCI